MTTEDRLIAEQNGSVTINVEPIPFAGVITITESAPKYRELTDEEIYKIGDKFVDNAFDEQGYSEFDRIGFARAILKREQEK
jgi:hypothetical protein